ncbi:ZN433 protein, partial [Amia calva]|nr:ZN433 protein [Amia calva]
MARQAKREVEGEGETYICSQCGVSLSSMTSFLWHQEQHGARGEVGRRCVCPHCSRAFTSPSNLKKHQVVHSGQRPYHCDLCGRTFNQSGNALRHRRSHHPHTSAGPAVHAPRPGRRVQGGGEEEEEGEARNGSDVTAMGVTTPARGGRPAQDTGLYRPSMRYRELEGDRWANVVGPAPTTLLQSRRQKSAKTSTGKQQWEWAGNSVGRGPCAETRNRRRGRGSGGEGIPQARTEPIPPPLTNAPSLPPSSFLDPPFPCRVCGRSFLSQGSLKIHERGHTGERPYRCPLCSKGFTNTPNFTRHLLVHTGEQPWQCGDCGRRFNQISNLNRHRRSHGHEGGRGAGAGVGQLGAPPLPSSSSSCSSSSLSFSAADTVVSAGTSLRVTL